MSRPARYQAVITDSGLGGLSIMAGIAAGLKSASRFEQIHLTYVNAWPDQQTGYHQLPDMTERARVFDRALAAMMMFDPDLIVIACNTLSVIYPHTRFSTEHEIEVVGIVTYAIEAIARAMAAPPERPVILFGTPVTIEAGVYTEGLRQRGIAPERIIEQACPRLAGEIERDPTSSRVTEMIDTCTAEGAARLRPAEPTDGALAGLCCTHYGYRTEAFARRLAAHSGRAIEVVTPTDNLVDSVVERVRYEQGKVAQVTLRVVSKVMWQPRQIVPVARYLEKISPESARALRAWEHMPDLFSR